MFWKKNKNVFNWADEFKNIPPAPGPFPDITMTVKYWVNDALETKEFVGKIPTYFVHDVFVTFKSGDYGYSLSIPKSRIVSIEFDQTPVVITSK